MGLHYFVAEVRAGAVVAVHPVRCAVDAEEGAHLAAQLSGGAIAYQQAREGEVWEAPDVLAVVGDVPRAIVEAASVEAA